MTLAAPRSRQGRFTLALAILAATVAFAVGLMTWSSNASADINTVSATVTQTAGPTTGAQPGDLIVYTYTVTGSSGGTTTNTRLIGTIDGGIPNGTGGANGVIVSVVGSGIWTGAECVIDPGAVQFTCTDPTGPLGPGPSGAVVTMQVLPAVGGDSDLNPPACLVNDDGAGEATCTTAIAVQTINQGGAVDATNAPGSPHTFTFTLADGVTCESDLLANDGLRSCNATDVTITNFGATCVLVSGPTVADTNLGNDSTVTVTINSPTQGDCDVTLAIQFDPQTCVLVAGVCPVPDFVDLPNLTATKTYTLQAGQAPVVIRHLDIPDAATEDESPDSSDYCPISAGAVVQGGPSGPVCGLIDPQDDVDDATGSQHGACIEGSTLTFALNAGQITWNIDPVAGGPDPVGEVPFEGPNGEPCIAWSAATVGAQSITAEFDPDGAAGPTPPIQIFWNGTPFFGSGLCGTIAPQGASSPSGEGGLFVCVPLIKEWNDIDFTEIVSVTGNVGDTLAQNTLELDDWVSRDCADSNSSFCARPNQDGQTVLVGGVPIGGGGLISASGRSFIDYVYGNHDEAGGQYPAPPIPETGAECFDALDNDDDGVVNDGCPTLGAPEVGGQVGPIVQGNGDCVDVADDDLDGRINDGCPAISVGPVDGVEQTYSINGSCGSVRVEDPTTGNVHILTLNGQSSVTVLSSDKGVGFQILPNQTGALATTFENADCGPNAEVCVTISSEEDVLFRSPPIDDAADEEVCVRFVVGPPTNKTPVLAWAGQRVVVQADWAVGAGADRVCPDYDGVGDEDEFGVAYERQAGPGGFTAELVGNANDVDISPDFAIVDVNREAEDENQDDMTDPNSDCISSIIYESQDQGQVDIVAFPVDDNDSLSDADPRGQQQAFVIYYMKLEDISLGLVPGERTGHNSGPLTGNSNVFGPICPLSGDLPDGCDNYGAFQRDADGLVPGDTTEVEANVSADVLARVRVRGWVLTDNCPFDRPAEQGANGELLPANRCIFPDDWRFKAGGALAEEFRPNFDTLGGTAVGCDSEGQGAAGPFSLLDRVPSQLNPLRLSPPFGNDPDAAVNSNVCGDSLAPHVDNGQPCRSNALDTQDGPGLQNECREVVFPNGVINSIDAQMPSALIRFQLTGSGFLKGTDKDDVYSGADDNFYVTHIPAEPWIAPINADLSGYQWDTWGGQGDRQGLYDYWDDLAETGAEVVSCPGQSPCEVAGPCPNLPVTNPSINPGCLTGGYKMTKVYSDNRGEAMTWINGDADLDFRDCLTAADVVNPIDLGDYSIKAITGFFCRPDDVVGSSTLTAAADYPDKRKHFPIASNDVEIIWLWGGEKTIEVTPSAGGQIHTVTFRATDRDDFCFPTPSFHPVFGERVDFLIDSGDGTIIAVSNFGSISQGGHFATTVTYDPVTSPDEDVCIASIDVLSTLIAEVDVFITAYDPEGTVSFDVILNPDQDGDGVVDDDDNCIDVPNPDQSDVDDDGIGDACDTELDPGSDDCTDGLDNDGDGDVDELDTGCQEQEGPPGDPTCSDGFDNDGDFLTDDEDPDCFSVALIWGDSDCDGEVDVRDSQALIRRVLGQTPLSQDAPCFALGTDVEVLGQGEVDWGDWDCGGDIDVRDSQALIRHVLGQSPLSQTQPCATIGSDVDVVGP